MNRREVVWRIGGAGGAGAALLLSCGALAQGSGKAALIAILGSGSAADERFLRSFRRGLLELGYAEGRHYIVEERLAEGVQSRLPGLAQELVRLKPDIILASSTQAALAARKATDEIPIVSPALGDAEGVGLIASRARPGGNVTGILLTDTEMAGKQLALARELVPGAARIGVLVNPQTVGHGLQRRGVESAAAALTIELVFAEARTADHFDGAFATLERANVVAVFVFGDPFFFAERRRLAAAAQSARLPTMYIFREHVEAGGLMSYGVDLEANFRRAAHYVDRVLKGAKPADLPVELPTRFLLVINLKTASAIGLDIPPTFLARADEVIE